MLKKLFTLQWLAYHIITLFDFAFRLNPIRVNANRLPLILIPGGSLLSSIFSLTSILLIFLPVIVNTAFFLNDQQFVYELLFISLFGLFFSIVFRSVQQEMMTLIVYHRRQLRLTDYGFFEKKIETIKQQELKELIVINKKYRGTRNYKLCVVLSDGRIVLLKLTTNFKKIEKAKALYMQFMQLKVSEQIPSGKPINDLWISYQRR